jgi:hypothetical protein
LSGYVVGDQYVNSNDKGGYVMAGQYIPRKRKRRPTTQKLTPEPNKKRYKRSSKNRGRNPLTEYREYVSKQMEEA